MKVVGVERKTGVFTDKATSREISFDNVYLHCIDNPGEAPTTMIEGDCVEVVKVAYPLYSEVCARKSGRTSLRGCDVTPVFNRYGKVTAIFETESK